jgi:uncharacterized membrane protein YozB (DUF420 family)
MAAPTATQFDLILQISILSLIAASMILEKKKKMALHGNTMIAAVALNIVSFIAVMGPAWDNVGESSTGTMGTIAMAHVVTGAFAFLLGIWLAGSWLLSTLVLKAETPKFMRCHGQKTPMWITLGLWVASLVFGILLFVMLNTSLLGNFPVFTGN